MNPTDEHDILGQTSPRLERADHGRSGDDRARGFTVIQEPMTMKRMARGGEVPDRFGNHGTGSDPAQNGDLSSHHAALRTRADEDGPG